MPTPLTFTAESLPTSAPWLAERREKALAVYDSLAWPTSRDEDWRFTNPKRISVDAPIVTAAVTVSGPSNVTAVTLPATGYDEILERHLFTVVPGGEQDEKFAALAAAGWSSGALVHVPAETVAEEPITVDITATDGVALGWVLVVLERHAEATVIVTGSGEADATVVDVVEAVIGEGATLNLVTTQNWGSGVDHVSTHKGRVGRDATYQHTEVTLGGDTVYIRPDVCLAEPGGSAELLGVYFPTGTETIEHRSLIAHDASHTTSEYVHKGALSGQAHATWYGNIRIDADAKQTSSDETNRNLILAPGARANTLPFLEIKTADVAACGHHSSVGQVDEVALWYLQSRGIPRDEAARMLVFAFFTEILDRVNAPGIEEMVLADVHEAVKTAPVTLMDPRRTAGARAGQEG